MIGNAIQRDGVRKELPRIALNRQVFFIYLFIFILLYLFFYRGNYINPTGVRPKPY